MDKLFVMPESDKLTYYLIGIIGGSASGKSLLISELRHLFSKDEICVISQDDYYKPPEFQLRDNKGIINFDLPEAIDAEKMFEDLISLSEGKTIKKQEYIFEHKDKIPELKIFKPSPIIIIEGIFLFYYKKISQLLDLKVFIHSDQEIRFKRRLERDTIERGISKKMIIHQWQNHVKPAFEKYVLPFIKRSDIVINNDTHYNKALEVLVNQIRTFLNK